MSEKIRQLPIRLYIKATDLRDRAKKGIYDFIHDENGLSGIVVAILLILVAVLLIVIIWGALSGWLGELWDRITGNAEQIPDVDPNTGFPE